MDNSDLRQVSTEDAQRFAEQMNLELFETSAKDNINVEEMFMAIAGKVMQAKLDQAAYEESQTIKVKPNKKIRKSKKC